MRKASIMGKMQETAQGPFGNPMPQFRDIRCIPTRYQDLLPLEVMKRYRCAIIGSAQGVLTVAIADRQDTLLVDVLTKLTGHVVFPVWVKPTRLCLLIQRIERRQQRKAKMLRWPHSLSLVQIHTIVMVPICQMKDKS